MTRMVAVRATQDMEDWPDREAVIDHPQVGGWAAAMHDLGYGVVEVRPIEEANHE